MKVINLTFHGIGQAHSSMSTTIMDFLGFIIMPILGKNLMNVSTRAVKDVDFNCPRLYIESKGDLTRILVSFS